MREENLTDEIYLQQPWIWEEGTSQFKKALTVSVSVWRAWETWEPNFLLGLKSEKALMAQLMAAIFEP